MSNNTASTIEITTTDEAPQLVIVNGETYVPKPKEAAPAVEPLGAVFAPSEGHKYFAVNADGVCEYTWFGVPYQQAHFNRGNVYRTKEEAQARADREALVDWAIRVRNDIWRLHGKPTDGCVFPVVDDGVVSWRMNALDMGCVATPWVFDTNSHYHLFITAMGLDNVRKLLTL